MWNDIVNAIILTLHYHFLKYTVTKSIHNFCSKCVADLGKGRNIDI